LEFDNTDGSIDYLLDLPIDGSDVAIYVGDPSWNFADFIHIYTAVSVKAACRAPGNVISIEIKDTGLLLNTTIGGVVAVGGTGPSANQFRAFNFGWVHQTAPIVVDEGTLTYAHSDTGVNTAAQDVRDNGVSVTFTDNADGTFTLAASPTQGGTITCDVLATLSGGTTIGYRISDFLTEMVGTRTGLTALGKYLGPQYSTLVGGLNDYPMGISISEARNVVDVLEDVMATRTGFWAVDRTGKFYYSVMRPEALSKIIADSGGAITVAETLVEDDVDHETLEIDHAAPGYASYQCYGNINWVDQTAFAGSVTQVERDRYTRKGYRAPAYYGEEPDSTQYLGATEAYLGGAPQLYHKSMSGVQLVATLISAEADDSIPDITPPANAWNVDTYLGAFISLLRAESLPWHEFIDISIGLEYFQLELGHIVNFNYPRYGLTGGVLFQVCSIEIDVTTERVRLGLVRRRFAGTSGPLSDKLLQENGDFLFQENGDYILL
jgi:hypothetical protein